MKILYTSNPKVSVVEYFMYVKKINKCILYRRMDDDGQYVRIYHGLGNILIAKHRNNLIVIIDPPLLIEVIDDDNSLSKILNRIIEETPPCPDP